MPYEVGTFEELGVSGSLVDGSKLLAKSAAVGLCLEQLQDFSPMNPSLSSSASLDDKPYDHTFHS